MQCVVLRRQIQTNRRTIISGHFTMSRAISSRREFVPKAEQQQVNPEWHKPAMHDMRDKLKKH